MSVRVTGLRGVLAGIQRAQRAMRDARDEVLEEWATDVNDSAQDLVPVRTGALNQSIEKHVYPAQGVARVGVWNTNTLEYAQYVEQGTSSMDDQPYLVPAFNLHRDVGRKYRAAFRRHFGGA